MHISIFGPLKVTSQQREVTPRDFPGVKPKQLLEILVVERGHSVSKGRLVDLLWTDRMPQNYLATLETYVSVLRQTLEPGVRARDSLIVTEHGGYRLDASRVTVDLDEFDSLLQQAAGAEPLEALALLDRAREIPRGQALEDEPYADWASPVRDSYSVRQVQSLIDAGRLSLLTGDPNAAFRFAEQAVAINPLAEAAYQILMTAAYATWRQEVALQAFDRCRRLLADELGVDPLDETVALHMAILRHEDVAKIMPRDPAFEPAAPVLAAAPKPVASPQELAGAQAPPLELLGRRPELERLEAAARAALNGRFSLLLVVGEPGLGKTTLTEALASRLGVDTGFNRCSDLESSLPYAAISLALRPILAPTSTDDFPVLASLLRRSAAAQPFDDFARLATMEELVHQLTDTEPFLLVLDDAQWADNETITTLGYLRRRSPTTPVAVVLTCNRLALRREALRNLTFDLRVDLDLLTASELASLDDPDVLEATSGHPAFIGAWYEARRNHLQDQFPQAVRDRTITRCWDLGPKAYRLLSIASVLDEPVKPGQLAALVGTSIDEIAGELDDLVEQRMLTADADGFRFRVAPERKILSETMSDVRRGLLRERSVEFGDQRPARPLPRSRRAGGEPIALRQQGA